MLNTTTLTCTSGNPAAYQVPNPWPECITSMTCPTPTTHPDMTHDWTAIKGTNFGVVVTWVHTWPWLKALGVGKGLGKLKGWEGSIFFKDFERSWKFSEKKNFVFWPKFFSFKMPIEEGAGSGDTLSHLPPKLMYAWVSCLDI